MYLLLLNRWLVPADEKLDSLARKRHDEQSNVEQAHWHKDVSTSTTTSTEVPAASAAASVTATADAQEEDHSVTVNKKKSKKKKVERGNQMLNTINSNHNSTHSEQELITK